MTIHTCSDGMEREACVCDHGLERSDLIAELIIIIIIIIIITAQYGPVLYSLYATACNPPEY